MPQSYIPNTSRGTNNYSRDRTIRQISNFVESIDRKAFILEQAKFTICLRSFDSFWKCPDFVRKLLSTLNEKIHNFCTFDPIWMTNDKKTSILYISHENVPGIVNDYFFWKITLFGYLTSFVHQHRVMESNLKSGNSTLTTCKFQNYCQCFQKIAPVYSYNLCVCLYN